MQVHQLGTGEPSVAVVAAIHGDEPCGVRAIERLRAADLDVERPVALVVANERALAAGVRYVDADLNRAFGEGESHGHEHALAPRLASALAGCTTLAIHSTRSYDGPFGIVTDGAGRTARLARRLGLDALVRVDADEGRLFACETTDLLEVEAGRQGTDRAAENATAVARAFLAATGAIAASPPPARNLPLFALGESVAKPPAEEYTVRASNFEPVAAGETYATADGRPLRAAEPFVPVLLSADGYPDQFGYAGRRLGTVTAEGPTAAGE